jgi:hypothetical protein
MKETLRMAILKDARKEAPAGYRGKRAKTGNSLGFRFDKALFQSHPEFSGEVRAHVIAPGRMLVVAEPAVKSRRQTADPVMESFLNFLAADMVRSPQQIESLDRSLVERIRKLVGHLSVNPDEDLGDEPIL